MLDEIEAKRKYQMYNFPSFSIAVTASIYHLIEGTPSKGFVLENTIIYYTFELNKPTAEILISLTPISSGDPDLVVDRGIEARPSTTKYRWASESFKSEHLIISPEDFVVGESMEGKYVIGVVGYTNCSYLLTVLFEENKISKLVQGVNYEFTIKANSILYLEYFHTKNENFTI